MIEVGEYVRTKNGKIIKFVKFGELRIHNKKTKGAYINETGHLVVKTITTGDNRHFKYDNIVKHSKNIIDLIEVGDYVNGEKVVQINCKLEYIDDDTDLGVNEVENGLELEIGWIYFGEEIKTIVTKEQFKSIEYRLEE